jgi:cytochrome c peroxidase
MRSAVILLALLALIALAAAGQSDPVASLGKEIFFDQRLSMNQNQSCASCHDPMAGWTGPDSNVNAGVAISAGSVAGRFGNRKPPSSAYATPSPIFTPVNAAAHLARRTRAVARATEETIARRVREEALFVGGNFWDGRATGERLGNPAIEQAQGPFLNPLEHALGSPADVVAAVCNGPYGARFLAAWGSEICDPDRTAQAYDSIARSIAAFEASPESNAFTSKFDYWLKGQVGFTMAEMRGFNFFIGPGQCSRCHSLDPADGMPPTLTDYTYDNIGIPKNRDNPFYTQTEFNPLGSAWVDRGLAGFLETRPRWAHLAPLHEGMHRVPTLRNVDKRPYPGFVKSFGHNGYFKTLEGIVHFYNTRDVKPRCADPLASEAEALAQNCWPAPEIEANMNRTHMGNLGLMPMQEQAIVAFLKALTDGYQQ